MEKFLGSLSKKKHHLLLVVLLTIFIVFDVPLPDFVNELIDNPIGKVSVAAGALCMLSVNPLIGVLSIIAAFVLIQRSSFGTGSFGLNNFLPSESKKSEHLVAMNDFPVSVEEQVISKMLPVANYEDLSVPEYKPVLDDNYDAADAH